MKKACFIIVNFGPAPPWKNLFMHSCSKNTDYDWMIYTDNINSWCRDGFNVPSNIHLKEISIQELEEKFKSTTGFNLCISRNLRKICDVKPFYGMLFAEDVMDYRYVGNCDHDVIWGDIEKFLGDAIDKEYDMISSRWNIMSGHCQLYKNKKEVLQYCMAAGPFRPLTSNIRDKEYLTLKEIMEDETHHSFDEPIYSSKLRTKKAREKLNIYWPLDLSNYTTDYINTIKKSNDKRTGTMRSECCWTYRDGKTFLDDHGEILYIHFMNWKDRVRDPDFDLNGFKLDRTGIHKC